MRAGGAGGGSGQPGWLISYFSLRSFGIFGPICHNTGSWTRLADLVLPEGHNHTASDTPGPRMLLNHNDGRFDMQLYMNSVRDVEGLSLLYGYFKLFDGPHASDQDIYSVAKGPSSHDSD